MSVLFGLLAFPCVVLAIVAPAGARMSERPGVRGPSTGNASVRTIARQASTAQPSASTAQSSASTAQSSALVVFLGTGQPLAGYSESAIVERELASIPTLSTGVLSATQGAYTAAQLALDITQGARVSNSAYKPAEPPFLEMGIPGVEAGGARTGGGTSKTDGARTSVGTSTGGGANVPVGRRLANEASKPSAGTQVDRWSAVLARARSAPQLLEPGLLAAQIPGGGAYVPADGVEAVDGVLAADPHGRVAAVSIVSGTLAGTVDRLRARHRLVVADLPSGPEGYADLRVLAASRPAGELLVVVQRVLDAPNNTTAGQGGHELLWVALAGIGQGGQTLTSQTTNQRGLIAAIDIAPTILEHLGLPIPADMRGRVIRTDGVLESAALLNLKERLGVISSRRLPALAWLVAVWALLLAGARLLDSRSSHTSHGGSHTSGSHTSHGGSHTSLDGSHGSLDAAVRPPRARAGWAMRTGALAMLWAPVAVLLPAALEPSRTAEFATLVALCFALGALTDRLLPWPRAPLAPALVAILALTIDALAGTQLLMRSLLGPSPAFGARFYGIGNELKSGLAVLVFSAVAAALYPAVRSRRTAATMACAGIVLAAVEGSARVGAGVGGVILVSAGAAVASVLLLPGSVNRGRVLLVMAAPVLGLIALATLDLATAHGGGHFTGSVLDARSSTDIRDIVVRRYGAAYDELKNHLMPLATALALLASVIAVRRRERLCAPVDSDPAWLAALAGGLAAGVIGALTEDSGPVLLVVAVFVLGCVLSYLWGKPRVHLARETPTASRGAVSALSTQHDLML